MGSDHGRWPGRWRRVQVHLPHAAEDQAVGLMQLAGGVGAEVRPAGPGRIVLTTWFESGAAAEGAARAFSRLPEAVVTPVDRAWIEDSGWLNATLQPRAPLASGRFLIVDRPPALGGERRRRIAIVLRPGRAFGTGEHPTTRMCLALLDRLLRPGASVLDLGAGSGILAIAAAKAGAREVMALDDDQRVIEVAQNNVIANGVDDRVRVIEGSWPDLPRGARFDLILANIHRTALVRGAGPLSRRLTPAGLAVLSGFGPEDAESVLAAWTKRGLRVAARLQDREWAALAVEAVTAAGSSLGAGRHREPRATVPAAAGLAHRPARGRGAGDRPASRALAGGAGRRSSRRTRRRGRR